MQNGVLEIGPHHTGILRCFRAETKCYPATEKKIGNAYSIISQKDLPNQTLSEIGDHLGM